MGTSNNLRITLRYTGNLEACTKKKEECLVLRVNATVSDILGILIAKYGKEIKKEIYIEDSDKPACILLVDGRSVSTDYILSDNDKVLFLSPVGGG